MAMPITAAPAPPAGRRLTGPLLIASEGGTAVAGALRVAEALARRDEVHVHVLGPARMRRKAHHTVGLSGDVRTRAKSGHAGSAAAAAARARGAECILVGLSPAGTRARASTLKTARRLAATARVPVLGVPADTESLPRRALVRIDFVEASMSAVGAIPALLGGGASLTVASAAPGEAHSLREFAATLDGLEELDVRAAALPGNPAALREFVRGFDLVVTTGMAPGDAAMLEAAPECVLVVPPPTHGR